MKIREATRSDAMAIAEVFNYYILNTAVTFEIEPLTPHQMEDRIAQINNDGYPFYVMEDDNRKVVGFYYLHYWNYRKGFHSTAELVIYVRHTCVHHNIASQLLEHLLANVGKYGFHLLIATVTVPTEKSTGILQKFNFHKAGELLEIGQKFGKMRNVEQWVLKLN